MTSAFRACQSTVRAADWEGYVASLFAPTHARNAIFAVRALNCEVSQIRDSISHSSSQNIAAGMRFKFWKDLVEGVYAKKPVTHHIAQLLSAALDEGAPLSKQFLLRIIAAREADFNAFSNYATTNSLESFADSTQSNILYLQLEACGVQNFKVDHIASHVGKALGIMTVLRGTPMHVSVRQLYLPSDVMSKHNISAEDVFRNGPSESLSDAVFELASLANNHLVTARAEMKELKEFPKVAIPALLPAVTCDSYLKRLERSAFNVFDHKLQTRDWRLLYNIWKSNKEGAF